MMIEISRSREHLFDTAQRASEVVKYIEAETNDVFELIAHAENEYAFTSEYFEKIIFRFYKNRIEIVDIRALNPGDGAGSACVDALKEVAKDLDCSIRALNVLPNAESWWEHQGFSSDAYGSDYEWSSV